MYYPNALWDPQKLWMIYTEASGLHYNLIKSEGCPHTYVRVRLRTALIYGWWSITGDAITIYTYHVFFGLFYIWWDSQVLILQHFRREWKGTGPNRGSDGFLAYHYHLWGSHDVTICYILESRSTWALNFYFLFLRKAQILVVDFDEKHCNILKN